MGNTHPPPRIGIYVCHCGGNISDVVDCAAVAKAAESFKYVAVAREHSFMCSDMAQTMIIDDIRNLGLNRVVIASCSPSLHSTTFRHTVERAGMNPYLYEHVNIREQVSWVHGGQNAAATAKAIRLVRAATAKAALLTAEAALEADLLHHALVIGGGVAGLRAARSLADAGVEVTLAERTPFLGGHTGELGKLARIGVTGRQVVDTLTKMVLGDSRIRILTNACVERIGGHIGHFEAVIRVRPRDEPEHEVAVQAGGVVVATGFEPYQPFEGELGWGREGVITLPQLVQILNESDGKEPLTIGGRAIQHLVMIHCVGSRQIDGIHQVPEGRTLNPQCSRMCCTAAIHNAIEIRRRFPDTRVCQLVRDVRTYGRHHEEDCYLEASRNRVLFFRYPDHEPPVVGDGTAEDDTPLAVDFKDLATRGEAVRLPADAVVLVTGMTPGDARTLIDSLKLAKGADGFLREVHPKLRPVELAVQGVMVAGTAQSPMAIEESTAAAAAAAVKLSKVLTRGTISLDPQVARVDRARCKGTGLCVEQCAYDGALRVIERMEHGVAVKRAEVNEALCKGCGACVAVCPHKAIDVVGSTLPQLYAMIDGLTAQEVL